MTFTAAPRQRVRHLKRGSVYHTIAIAELQASGTLVEGDKLVIYKSSAVANPKVWAREKSEFEDGRFQLWGSVEDDPLAHNALEQIVADTEEVLGELLANNLILTHDAMVTVRKLFNRCQAVENERARQLVEEARKNAR